MVHGTVDWPFIAVEWRPGGGTDVIGTFLNRPCVDPSNHCDESFALGVNNDGVVVGRSTVADATTHHAFAFHPDTRAMADLGTLPGGTNSVAYGINDAGLVVGSSEVGGDPVVSHAFSYDLHTGVMTDLGVLPGGTSSEARAVNENGLIVGSGHVPGGATHPFTYDSTTGTMTDLGALPGEARTRPRRSTTWVSSSASRGSA